MANTSTLLILGASGDLTSRLLLPALGQLLTMQPERTVTLMGAGMDDWTDERWQGVVKDAFISVDAEDAFERVAATRYQQADITATDDLKKLLSSAEGHVAVYFAVPPAVAATACEALNGVDLPDGLVLALEKPFGTSQKNAEELNAKLAALLPERQIFRVDHFLGRSTLLNILGLRFANQVFEPVWSADHIAEVEIRFDESLGLEGRAGYYDKAGALRDMLQSHLLQVLAIVAMGPPASIDETDLRAATAAALRATHVWDDDPVVNSGRARYTAGNIDDRDYPSYVDEPGVDPSRDTETLAEAKFEVRNARWAGVPFTLRSGKALSEPRTEIALKFRPVRHLPSGFAGAAEPSVLRMSLGPDTMSLELNVNGGEDPFELQRVHLDAALGAGSLRAYAEVLSEVLDGEATLSVRGDAAEQCWRIVQPILDAWEANEVPLDTYPAGSRGPAGWDN
ncbi:glucose-6-phosphate 1-dehydrogenase [Microbacterium endophyticum]|uniref:Glucose-6-phosphate 1-dehydrogenase n=1 Tax=Microbacterium endophyticum TaxID=1526412 RepID=A0A7W4V4R2_9MICO|nr:glucose-6-phosphate dehydrogenase [Microbacterium endophyticum]MBB2976847.1 glucose-6-phosphate 1-dehydrogenase [Microbacterium endophyticum]NIK35835.1 glucose-6-phosphate 1-dehydrogenase [Microbacterium endophyticum]